MLCQKIKFNSSRWFKTKDVLMNNFSWQDGYGAFSVSPSHVQALTQYIENQREHHSNASFKEEYLGLLKRYDMDYDENFLW